MYFGGRSGGRSAEGCSLDNASEREILLVSTPENCTLRLRKGDRALRESKRWSIEKSRIKLHNKHRWRAPAPSLGPSQSPGQFYLSRFVFEMIEFLVYISDSGGMCEDLTFSPLTARRSLRR